MVVDEPVDRGAPAEGAGASATGDRHRAPRPGRGVRRPGARLRPAPDRGRLAFLHPARLRRRCREVRAGRPAGPAHAGGTGDAGGRRLPATGQPVAGLGGARGQLRRRDAHPPAAGSGGGVRARKPRQVRSCTGRRTTSWSGWACAAWTSCPNSPRSSRRRTPSRRTPWRASPLRPGLDDENLMRSSSGSGRNSGGNRNSRGADGGRPGRGAGDSATTGHSARPAPSGGAPLRRRPAAPAARRARHRARGGAKRGRRQAGRRRPESPAGPPPRVHASWTPGWRSATASGTSKPERQPAQDLPRRRAGGRAAAEGAGPRRAWARAGRARS